MRDAGLIACLVGVIVMALGRFGAHVPGAMVYVGVAIIVVGWALLIVSAWKRTRIPRPTSSRAERNEV